MEGGPVLLVDGLNLFIRNFCANPLVVEGQHVGGIVGSVQSLGFLVRSHTPSEVVVVWEGGGSSRRRAINPNYKNGRRPVGLNRNEQDGITDTVENRNWQLKFLVNVLQDTPVRQIYITDVEADDVIGYMARYMFEGKNIIICSSDHDYYQLLSERVSIYSPTLKEMVTLETFRQKYEVTPWNFMIARCFMGDASDALPGIEGIGLKTLLNRVDVIKEERKLSVDDVISECESKVTTSKVKAYKSIVDNAHTARTNFRLMTLDTSNLSGSQVNKIQRTFDLEVPNPNKMSMIRKFVKVGIKTFDIDRFFLAMNSIQRVK